MAFDPLSLAELSASAPAFEQSVLAALAAEFGFDAAFFATPAEVPTTTVDLDGEAQGRAFARRDFEDELMPLERAAPTARGVVVDTALPGERSVRAFVTPGGAVALNVIGTVSGASAVQAMVDRPERCFDDVLVVPVLDPGESFRAGRRRNVVLVGRR